MGKHSTIIILLIDDMYLSYGLYNMIFPWRKDSDLLVTWYAMALWWDCLKVAQYLFFESCSHIYLLLAVSSSKQKDERKRNFLHMFFLMQAKWSPLHTLTLSGQIPFMDVLIDNYGTDIDSVDKVLPFL